MVASSSLAGNPGPIVAVGLAVSFFVLAMEQVVERQQSWRLTRKKFATDRYTSKSCFRFYR